jgi:acetyl-CoA acyltransferase
MPVSKRNKVPAGRSAVVIGGVRTPFVKAFGDYLTLDSIALGAAAVRGLCQRHAFDTRALDAIIWSGVILPGGAPNVGREIVLDLKLGPSVEAMTVTRACISGLQAITLAAAAIERGEADIVIAGGSESTSNTEVKLPQKIVHAAVPFAFGKASAGDFVALLRQMWPLSEALPRAPKVAERSTGQVMGEAAEDMARKNGISRESQDEFAMTSHRRAHSASASGRFKNELVPIEVARNEFGIAGTSSREGGSKIVDRDGLVRADTTPDKLARLKPAFAPDGSVTAGNSSPLTDGAAATLLMSEEKAAALGLTPLARFASWAYVGVDPTDQLLIGPALAMPLALERAGYRLSEIDFVDMHEAFAAQVLSVVRALADAKFARDRLGRSEAVGTIDPERLNIHGGSLALGHPFAATGARMVTTMANELALSGKRCALLGICAAGGLGAAAVLENASVP